MVLYTPYIKILHTKDRISHLPVMENSRHHQWFYICMAQKWHL